MHFIKKTFYLIFVLIVLIAFYSCLDTNLSNPKDEEKTGDSYSFTLVQKKLLQNKLESFGTVSYKDKNDVTVLVEGKINDFIVKEGEFVKKNQIIARLYNVQLEVQKKQYESNLDSAKSSLKYVEAGMRETILNIESRLIALEKSKLNIEQKQIEKQLQEKTLENKKALNKIGGVTDSSIKLLETQIRGLQTEIEVLEKEYEISELGLRDEDLISAGIVPSSNPQEKKQQLLKLNTLSKLSEIESAQSQVKSAEQQLESINYLMDELVVKSPCSGIVGQNYYSNGEYIRANEKLTTIIDTQSVFAQIYIQEKDMVNFEKGQNINLEIPSLNQKESSVICEISPIADVSSGNFMVKAKIKNEQNKLKPGMFVKCSIDKEKSEETLCFSESAILSESSDKAKIFTVQNGYAIAKTVEIFRRKDGFIFVKDGLVEGENLIDKPSPFIREGQKIKND
ncbi:efflux RND transporter periplasmic adaptor subunit [Treponema pectinovorum]|uniref:efflux RND transporter periplasmic adaptor subunit n=1 Tax=Treponema pectinovorum TaxID=164 RepID=UPI0011C798A3|nr:efflux RND transporter periplasmic adaptor subunit [Treponema pectinovorum]